MEKMRFESVDGFQENIRRLADIFPSCVKEQKDNDGKTIRKVDINTLQLLLGINQKESETCEFSWVGKREAVKEVYKPIRKTLRPVVQDSVEWDSTGNLYIEGDNLDVLKLLQESYLDSVKVIYIDPPYNTGNDFIYEDDFSQSADEYLGNSGQFDKEGNRLVQNTESNGRFHTDWLNMMYPRLRLAKDLLADDGVILISLDDKESASFKMVCNEKNFLECLIWKKRATPPNDKNIGRIHEFVYVYCKNIENVSLGLLPRNESSIARYSNPDNDARGPWVASDLSANGKGGRIVQSCIYPIKNPSNGKIYYPSEGRCWLFNKEKMDLWIKEGRVSFRDNTGAP